MFIVPPAAYIYRTQNQTYEDRDHKSNLLLFNKTRKVKIENMNIEIRTFEIEKLGHDSSFNYRLNEEIKKYIGNRKLIDYQIIPIETEYRKYDKTEYVKRFMVVLTLKS